MTSTLADILAEKHREVEERKALYPLRVLEQRPFYSGPAISLKKYLARPDLVGVIAEIKRASPSAGIINQYISVEQLSIGYMQQGASALSVLTDSTFFRGSLGDLETARRFNLCPILRKDFIIDEYQIHESRAWGADVILLIAAALSPETCAAFTGVAHRLGLEVLLEAHTKEEFESHYTPDIDCVGVNSRDLRTMTVSLDRALELRALIPSSCTAIAESGIKTPDDLLMLKTAGFSGFLIGETFMRSADPARAAGEFIRRVRELSVGAH